LIAKITKRKSPFKEKELKPEEIAIFEARRAAKASSYKSMHPGQAISE
jgi:hypothetical protein